jgi:dihydroorotate dehydrogenase (NAD+) catalytic subunit
VEHLSKWGGEKLNDSEHMLKPTWDPARSFQWHYHHGPLLDGMPHGELPQQPVTFLSWQLRLPLGVAAGPLANARFVAAYARLGYSLLTYKSVRSRAWEAHPAPILGLVRPDGRAGRSSATRYVVDGTASRLSPAELSSANSVGLPSPSPEEWRADVRRARESLGQGQVLIVSVVGTPEPGGSAEQLADDFARCARWAGEAGADIIEVNLSCPNVHDGRGDVYLDPSLSELVVSATRAAIGHVPLSAKLGYYADVALLRTVLAHIRPYVDALTLINAIKRPVIAADGHPYFPGAGRERAGIGGAAIRALALGNVRSAVTFLREQGSGIPVIAVGGVTAPGHVDEYLALGAAAVALGTSAIWQPFFSYDYARFQAEQIGAMRKK